ncbi:MAG: thioredoxin family protein [Planctomycetes bacterium]|nr:thioredoxin family protein [Planctomycetota bacterium]
MRTFKLLQVLGPACVLCLGIHAARAAEPVEERSVAWLTEFSKAQRESRRLNRPLLVHFYADWCTPCRRMERTVLENASVRERLASGFVAVKIDSDRHPELVRRFDVQSLPTDLIFSPDGRLLSATQGVDEATVYLARLERVAPSASTRPLPDALMDEERSQQVPVVFEGDHMPLPPADESGSTATPAQPPPAPPLARGEGRVGLEGFSPVSLWSWREWRKGDARFSVEHQGVTYLLASADEAEQFKNNPDRYVPRLLGCDPVVLFDTDRAVPGQTKYGAYYEGELYLFISEENRTRFKESPQRYTRTRHVLKLQGADGVGAPGML